MKRVFVVLMCFILFITVDVKALGLLPAIITSNDNKESQAIGFLDGEYTLPEFCSIEGCTINVDINSLMAIGKYKFNSREEYFYISEGGGATIYEKEGNSPVAADVYEDNFNKIVIESTKFLQNSYVTIKMGSLNEERTIKLVPYRNIPITENPDIEENDPSTPIVVITGSDINDENPITEISTITDIGKPSDDFNTQTDEVINNSNKKDNKSAIMYILIGLGFLMVISANSLLSIRKKQSKI